MKREDYNALLKALFEQRKKEISGVNYERYKNDLPQWEEIVTKPKEMSETLKDQMSNIIKDKVQKEGKAIWEKLFKDWEVNKGERFRIETDTKKMLEYRKKQWEKRQLMVKKVETYEYHSIRQELEREFSKRVHAVAGIYPDQYLKWTGGTGTPTLFNMETQTDQNQRDGIWKTGPELEEVIRNVEKERTDLVSKYKEWKALSKDIKTKINGHDKDAQEDIKKLRQSWKERTNLLIKESRKDRPNGKDLKERKSALRDHMLSKFAVGKLEKMWTAIFNRKRDPNYGTYKEFLKYDALERPDNLRKESSMGHTNTLFKFKTDKKLQEKRETFVELINKFVAISEKWTFDNDKDGSKFRKELSCLTAATITKAHSRKKGDIDNHTIKPKVRSFHKSH